MGSKAPSSETTDRRVSDFMKLLTILGVCSALISGTVTWMINYGVANGQTIRDIEYAGKERVRIELQAKENIKEIKRENEETRKKAENNEKKITEMYGAINETRNAVKRIEERLNKP